MLVLLILSSLILAVPTQKTTSSAARRIVPGWFPNACTLVICSPPERSSKEENGEQELPGIQALWGPPTTPGPKGGQGSRGYNKLPELQFLQTQIKDLQAQLDIFKAAVTKTQEVLLAPNGVIVGEKIFKTDGSKGDYDAAQANCEHMGATLAVPRDVAENKALQKIVTWHNRRAILGINDMATEGIFKDLNGQVIQYSNWAPGEPNNAGNEDCVEVHPDGKWHDRGCTLEWNTKVES
ncbi:pulmonary surfactant-associated protein D-like isoform X1 [Sceloporus undulatus]|uniref:pulmonary surfactant-associated protein D-like isoform X1 n=1 Tax=Sceloporus undulatus TaxID=8520 RepID=UPI001C4CD939|nr:pulmonary surfactant-associated protein D-like isoform X1 [Sceloporus undulatus]